MELQYYNLKRKKKKTKPTPFCHCCCFCKQQTALMGTQDFAGTKRRKERHASPPQARNPGSLIARKNLHQLPFLSPVQHQKSISHVIPQESGDINPRDGETNVGLITVGAWQTAPGKMEAHRHAADVRIVSSPVLAFPPLQNTRKDLHNHPCCSLPSPVTLRGRQGCSEAPSGVT